MEIEKDKKPDEAEEPQKELREIEDFSPEEIIKAGKHSKKRERQIGKVLYDIYETNKTSFKYVKIMRFIFGSVLCGVIASMAFASISDQGISGLFNFWKWFWMKKIGVHRIVFYLYSIILAVLVFVLFSLL
jgi:hypothetical protein